MAGRDNVPLSQQLIAGTVALVLLVGSIYAIYRLASSEPDDSSGMSPASSVGPGRFTGKSNGVTYSFNREPRRDNVDLSATLDVQGFGRYRLECHFYIPQSASEYHGSSRCDASTARPGEAATIEHVGETFSLAWDGTNTGWWLTLETAASPSRVFLSKVD